jgi:hypothetical protein
MPTRTCTCITSKCGLVEGGVELDIRTYRNHLHKDREFSAAKLAEDSKQVLDDEIEKIGQHFASLAVSDSIPAPSSTSGERLWSQPGDKEDTNSFVPLPSNPYSSRQQIIRNLLSRLAEIESAVDILAVAVAGRTRETPYNSTYRRISIEAPSCRVCPHPDGSQQSCVHGVVRHCHEASSLRQSGWYHEKFGRSKAVLDQE